MLTLSARVDSWQNYDGHILETTVATGCRRAGNRGDAAGRDDTVVSPRAAALYRITDRVSVWGDVGWGFRAPTLNELYRQFSVGPVLTLANENARPRAAVRRRGWRPASRRRATSSIRSTWYDNRVKNPVSNVTIGTNLQQRQNLGRTRIRGWQNDVEYRVSPSLRADAAAICSTTRRSRSSTANPALVGLYLPQVPKHRGSVSVAYSNPRFVTVAATGMFFGRQFDDDLNTRTKPGETEPGLPPYGVAGLQRSRATSAATSTCSSACRTCSTRSTTCSSCRRPSGSPRLVNGGIRVRWSGR